MNFYIFCTGASYVSVMAGGCKKLRRQADNTFYRIRIVNFSKKLPLPSLWTTTSDVCTQWVNTEIKFWGILIKSLLTTDQDFIISCEKYASYKKMEQKSLNLAVQSEVCLHQSVS